jgi:ubiquinone biosynthesis protein
MSPHSLAVPRPTDAARHRYRDVAAVLLKYGLADLAEQLKLTRYAPAGRHLLPRRLRVDPSLTREARLRLTLEELGPTFVKFGQALSVRSDLLSPELVTELSRLQDQVPGITAGQAETSVEAAFDRPLSSLFASFSPSPFAAGSMAQVHHAVLVSGEPVVVKVRRPGIGPVIAADLDLLGHLARLSERHMPAAAVIDPVGLVAEFARTIRLEQDLAREGRSIERCARAFAGDRTVHLPRVYWERTCESVLTLERLEGVKISDLAASPTLSPFARRLIAQRGADAMVRQILLEGFFHADPHPGNVLVLPGFVIGFLDFGIVGRADDRTRRFLAAVIHAVAARDARRLSRLTLEIAHHADDVDRDRLERDMSVLLDDYGNVALGELSLDAVLGDVLSVAASHKLRLPSNLMLLVKAVVTIEGVGRQLDPGFKMAAYAAPVVRRLWRERHTSGEMARRLGQATTGAWTALGGLPGQLQAVLHRAATGRIDVQLVHRNLEFFVREMDRSSNRLSFAVVIGALIVGSSVVLQSGLGVPGSGSFWLGLAGFVIAGVLGIGLAVGIVRSGRL